MTKVTTIGGATQDIFICQDNPRMLKANIDGCERMFLALQEGAKIEVKNLGYHTGGGATNSAVSFAHLGFDTSCCIKTGDDDQAKRILDQLKEHNITPYQTIDTHLATGTSFILPTEHKDRVVLVWRGANTHLDVDDIPQQAIADTDCVYITSLSGDASHAFLPIVERIKRLGKNVATNPGTSQLKADVHSFVRALAYIDILVLNSYEAQLCMQALFECCDDIQIQQLDQPQGKHTPDLLVALGDYKGKRYTIKDFFRAAASMGPKIIAVTNGKEGVYVSSKQELLFHKSLPTNVINTLGAGDAFGSAFVAGILQGKDIQTATIFGLLNAQSVIEKLDAKSGLLHADQLEAKFKKAQKAFAVL